MAAMNEDKLRAWWSARQGLDASLKGKSAHDVLQTTGWARSVGGVGPYLTVYARSGLDRAEIDGAIAEARIHELPSARGCTYVVPESDYAIALTVGQQFSAETEYKLALKLGAAEKEIDKLRAAILKALEKAPLDPAEMRKIVGPAARNFGPEGQKKGITTTIPVALGLMQSAGEIRRIPMEGRLDAQRFQYSLWKNNPLLKWKKSREETFVELARRYFSWIGAAKLTEFQWFSGLGVKASKDATAPLKLVAWGDGYLMTPDQAEAFEKFQAPKKPQYSLVSSIDGIGQLRRNLVSLLAPADRERNFMKGKSALLDFPDHGILDRGRLVGLWAFDTADGTIVWNSFIKPDTAMKDAVRTTETWVREQLGDARGFSLDSPKSRESHIAEMRKAGIY
jgi:hypothetical protein